MAIDRSDIGTNDDGSGTTGTVLNAAYIALALYDKIDAALALLFPLAGGTVTGVAAFTATPTVAAGIQFPAVQAAQAGANVLDDYEEGVWTPVLGGAGGTSGQTYSSQTGHYVKVGRLVYCWFIVTLTAKGTITGAVQIQGLPFTADFYSTAQPEFNALATNWINVILRPQASSTTCLVTGAQAAGTSNIVALGTADITDTTQMICGFSYRTAN
jgi:predicted secreted protein